MILLEKSHSKTRYIIKILNTPKINAMHNDIKI